ncbi:hypothetical protein VR7878_00422 [Vibrio ruber DSM 16370]|uniref:Uncharacterized protein n=1 Tax=Vibrio ruber (strain DSM 16370 / JCM 11486 / BCRC 17186 / CECT 7878 / LMG 23124 / VR1) TaxID=1123498 RepID=A0A1R4LB70_VIBR1|nr:hypothetical protein VR7878_00422 [Vibrio ruber DSM 16370]
MNHDHLNTNLIDSDQSVKNFMASLYETFSVQLKQQDEPRVKIEYFGAVIEVQLVSFDGVYKRQKTKK